MNYLQQINGFWAKNETSNLNSTDIAVYFALLNYCNRLNWLNPFVCHWDILTQYAKCSKNSFYKSMSKLNDEGFIQYSKGERNKKLPKVLVLKFENNKGTNEEQQGNNKGTEREQVVEQKGNLYKHNNNNIFISSNELERWLKSNDQLKDDMCRVLSLTPTQLEKHIEVFALEQGSFEITHDDERPRYLDEKKTHFIRWVRKKLKDEQEDNKPYDSGNAMYKLMVEANKNLKK